MFYYLSFTQLTLYRTAKKEVYEFKSLIITILSLTNPGNFIRVFCDFVLNILIQIINLFLLFSMLILCN